MDFITHLPTTRSGYSAIFVIVDRLTKMIHFLTTADTATAEETAALFRDRVFVLHGMPQSTVSDRVSQKTIKPTHARYRVSFFYTSAFLRFTATHLTRKSPPWQAEQ